MALPFWGIEFLKTRGARIKHCHHAAHSQEYSGAGVRGMGRKGGGIIFHARLYTLKHKKANRVQIKIFKSFILAELNYLFKNVKDKSNG